MEALDRKIGVELPLRLRERLLADARDAVLHQISDKLWDHAKRAPHQVWPSWKKRQQYSASSDNVYPASNIQSILWETLPLSFWSPSSTKDELVGYISQHSLRTLAASSLWAWCFRAILRSCKLFCCGSSEASVCGAFLQIKQADEDELVEQRKFLAVCWGPGDPATTLVMLDHAGQLVDTCYTGMLSGNIPRSRSLDNNPMTDPAKVCA